MLRPLRQTLMRRNLGKLLSNWPTSSHSWGDFIGAHAVWNPNQVFKCCYQALERIDQGQ